MAESCAEHLLSLLPILGCLNAQRKKTQHALSGLIKEAQTCPEHPMHATVRAMLSLPGLGVLNRDVAELYCTTERRGNRFMQQGAWR